MFEKGLISGGRKMSVKLRVDRDRAQLFPGRKGKERPLKRKKVFPLLFPNTIGNMVTAKKEGSSYTKGDYEQRGEKVKRKLLTWGSIFQGKKAELNKKTGEKSAV